MRLRHSYVINNVDLTSQMTSYEKFDLCFQER